MIDFLFIIALAMLIVGSYTDLKTREVPDWLNFTGIIVAAGVRLLQALAESSWQPLIEGVFGFVVFFAIACTMYYLGQWGGGDAKMLMALGALLGLQIDINHFMVGFTVNALFVGGLYGLVWCIIMAITHWKGVHEELEKMYEIHSVKVFKLFTYVAAVIVLLLAYFSEELRWAFLVLAGLLMALFHLWILIRAVEIKGMIKRRKISELTEGDWVTRVIKHKGKFICGPKDLGLTKKQIKLLKRHGFKSISIKEGIPFIPSFLITFVATYFIGNVLIYFL